MRALAGRCEALSVFPLENHADRLAEAVRDAIGRYGGTLSALESCTGGLVASTLTDVPGAGYFLGGAVAYSPEAKVKFGVPADVMDRCGLVSREVALAMAESAAEWFGTDVGLGVTGVAGPDAEDGIPAGTAFAAVWSRGRGAAVVPIEVPVPDGDRKAAKADIALLALGLLLEELDHFRPRPPSPMVEAWIGR
jgi:PncC family amidohydrolase